MCPKLLLFWWIKSLRFLVYNHANMILKIKKEPAMSNFLVFQNYFSIISSTNSFSGWKPKRTNYKIAFYWFISMMSTTSHSSRLLTIPPAMPPLHSYLLENNQKVALPASLIKNGAFTLSLLEDRQYQY